VFYIDARIFLLIL